MKLIMAKPVNKAISNLAIVDTDLWTTEKQLVGLGAVYHDKRFAYQNRIWKDTEKEVLYSEKHYELPFSLIPKMAGDSNRDLRLRLRQYDWDDDAKELWTEANRVGDIVKQIEAGNMDVVLSVLEEAGLDPNLFVRKNDSGSYAMRPHQLAALALHITCKFSANWGQMRTGKTPPALIYTFWLLGTHQIDMAIYLVPNSIKHGWKKEIPKDMPKEMTYLTDVIEGTKPKKEKLWRKRGFIKIVNYAAVRVDIDMILETLEDKRYLLVIDEAHNIKNPDSKQTAAVKRLDPDFLVALTGTIVANKPEDVFVPTQIVAPQLLGFSYANFARTFCKVGGWAGADITGYKKNGIWGTHSALEELHRRMKTISVAAQREDIGILFGKTTEIAELEMSQVMAGVYKAANTQLVAELMSSDGMTAVKITSFLARLVRLQQILAGFLPEILPDGTRTGKEVWFDDKDNVKLTWLDNFIREYLDDIGKLVIFSRFVPVIKKLEGRYLMNGATAIYGDVKPEERIKRVEDFRNSSDVNILIVNVDIAAGLDMNPAQNAVFYERTFYYMPNSQAEDRITGINQVGDSTIIPLMVKGTIDESLEVKVLPKKKEYADAIIKGGGDDKVLESGLKVTQQDLFDMLGV